MRYGRGQVGLPKTHLVPPYDGIGNWCCIGPDSGGGIEIHAYGANAIAAYHNWLFEHIYSRPVMACGTMFKRAV